MRWRCRCLAAKTELLRRADDELILSVQFMALLTGHFLYCFFEVIPIKHTHLS
jgi:hypothetical protein